MTIMAMNRPEPALALGSRIKSLRKSRGLTLADLARSTDVSEATLSRVENDQTLVSAHHLYQLATSLSVDITAFFEDGTKPIAHGIRSISRKGEGLPLQTARYEAQVLCTDIANKKMHPAINIVTIRTIEEAGGLSQHEGEEYLHVLAGKLSFISEFYEPLALEAGDNLYFDSNMGHAYLSADGAPVTILVVATTEPPA
jgi:transcriptional regulator with XRE-family HTH domain